MPRGQYPTRKKQVRPGGKAGILEPDGAAAGLGILEKRYLRSIPADVRALADIIMDEMQNATERKAAVFGA